MNLRSGGDSSLVTAPQLDLQGAKLPLLLWVTLVVTLVLASLEGYLQDVSFQLSKVAPILFLAVYAVHRIWGSRPIGVSHPVTWCVAGLMPVLLASSALNADNGYAMAYLLRWLPFLLLVLALTDVLVHDIEPWVALYALVAGATLASCGALVSFVFLGSPRATGPMEDPNDLAYVLTAAVPIVLLAVARSRHRWARVGWGLVLALLLTGTAATVSRGGALAVAAVLIWLAVRTVVPKRFLSIGLVLLVAVAVPLVLMAQDVVEKAVAQKQFIADSNVETRLMRWQASARMLGDHLLLGVGPGGFRDSYIEYSHFAELAHPNPVAHQMYLEVGAELGLLGLVIFLAAIVAAIVASEQAVRARRAVGAGPTDRLLLAALAVQGSLLAVCISSIFLSQQYYMQLWAGLAIAAAIHVRTTREAAA